jgi:hypothetical protein
MQPPAGFPPSPAERANECSRGPTNYEAYYTTATGFLKHGADYFKRPFAGFLTVDFDRRPPGSDTGRPGRHPLVLPGW